MKLGQCSKWYSAVETTYILVFRYNLFLQEYQVCDEYTLQVREMKKIYICCIQLLLKGTNATYLINPLYARSESAFVSCSINFINLPPLNSQM